jgi:hypothetical protein
MLQIVVVINILISAVLLYVAWRIWLLKRLFANLSTAFNAASRNTSAVLSTMPSFLYIRQTTIQNLRVLNRGLESKFQKSSQLLSLLLIASRFWRRNRSR